jgi:predicted ATP-grasp superfamily ATP-dependent carboligase
MQKFGYNLTKRNESLEHGFWVNEIEKFLKRRYEVVKEMKIEGKSVDLVYKKNGKLVAVEVETGKSDWVENARKCLEQNFSKVVVVAIDNRIKEEIEIKLNTKDERLKICSVKEFLRL